MSEKDSVLQWISIFKAILLAVMCGVGSLIFYCLTTDTITLWIIVAILALTIVFVMVMMGLVVLIDKLREL